MTPPQGIRMDRKPGVWRRGIALALDVMFLSLFFFPITFWYSGKWLMRYEDHLWGILDPICLVFLFIIFAYFILMEAYAGWTVGKRILSMKVTDAAGNKITLGQSLIRNLLRLVDGLPALNILGIALIATSPRGQRLGDRMARSYAIRIQSISLTCTGTGNHQL